MRSSMKYFQTNKKQNIMNYQLIDNFVDFIGMMGLNPDTATEEHMMQAFCNIRTKCIYEDEDIRDAWHQALQNVAQP